MRSRKKALLLALCLTAVVGLSMQCAVRRFRSQLIPALFQPNGKILVLAEVGGVQGWYVLDTASGRTLVTQEVATKLQATEKTAEIRDGFSDHQPIHTVRVRSGAVRFASWRLRYPEDVTVADLKPVAAAIEHELDGLLGWDVLQNYVLGFDASTQRLLGGKNSSAADVLAKLGRKGEATALPLRLVHELPALTADSGSEKLKMNVDTGSAQTVLSAAAWCRLGGDPLDGADEGVLLSITGKTTMRRARLSELCLGSLHVKDVPVMVQPIDSDGGESVAATEQVDGILGMDVLSRYLVVIDGLHSVLYLAERAGP